jgi:hypothetical protein
MDRIGRMLAASAIAAVMASCGESPPEAAEPEGAAEEQQNVSVTFSSTGCSLQGSGRIGSGQVAFTLVNESPGEARIHLWMIEEGHIFADFAGFLEEEAARMESGKEPHGAPGYVTFMTEIAAEGGTSGAGEASVDEGSYAFACFPWKEANGEIVHETIYSAGPLEVTS